MRKIKLYIATSLDNYIARPDGSIDWLESFPTPKGEDFGYGELMKNVDTTLMGNKTYQQVLGFDMPFPYTGCENYVFTRQQDLTSDENVQFISSDVVAFIQNLKNKPGKDIWLIGGGQLNTIFLNADLIDEMMITILPIVLGEGIPLFAPTAKEKMLHLKEFKAFENGFVQLIYRKK